MASSIPPINTTQALPSFVNSHKQKEPGGLFLPAGFDPEAATDTRAQIIYQAKSTFDDTTQEDVDRQVKEALVEASDKVSSETSSKGSHSIDLDSLNTITARVLQNLPESANWKDILAIFALGDSSEPTEGTLKLEEFMEELGKLEPNDAYLSQVTELLEKTEPHIRKQLSQHFITVRAELEFNAAVEIASRIDGGKNGELNNFIRGLQKSLTGLESGVDREVGVGELQRKQDIKSFFADKMNLYLRTNESISQDAVKLLPKWISELQESGVVIYKEDVQSMINHLEQLDSHGSTAKDQQARSEGFFDKLDLSDGTKVMALFLLPIFAGPLSGILRKVPLIGNTLNNLLGSVAGQGSTLMTYMVADMVKGSMGKKQPPAPEKVLDSQINANQYSLPA